MGDILNHLDISCHQHFRRVIEKRVPGICFQRKIPFHQLFIHVHVTVRNPVLDRIFLPPYHTVFSVHHLQVQRFAAVRQSERLRIQPVGFEPQIFPCFIDTLVCLQIHKFRRMPRQSFAYRREQHIYIILGKQNLCATKNEQY